jgi:hypothetical protein
LFNEKPEVEYLMTGSLSCLFSAWQLLRAVLRIQDVLSGIPDPDPNSFPSQILSFFIPDPGSYIKRGMKNKNYLFSCFLWFKEKILVGKKIIHPESGSPFREKFIPDPDPGSGSATLVEVNDF